MSTKSRFSKSDTNTHISINISTSTSIFPEYRLSIDSYGIFVEETLSSFFYTISFYRFNGIEISWKIVFIFEISKLVSCRDARLVLECRKVKIVYRIYKFTFFYNHKGKIWTSCYKSSSFGTRFSSTISNDLPSSNNITFLDKYLIWIQIDGHTSTFVNNEHPIQSDTIFVGNLID